MKKNLFVVLFVFVLPSVSFSQSSFESRHSLMPKSFDEVKEDAKDSSVSVSNVPVALSQEEKKSDIYAEPVIVSSDGIKVDDGNESFFLKRPVVNNVSDGQNDFTTTGPKLDKPDGYDELMQMVREQGGVIKPSSYVEDRNGNLVLSSPENKPVNIVSNVIEEKKEDVVSLPLYGNSVNEKKKDVNVEKKDVVVKDRNTPYQSVAHVASYKDRASANKGIDVFVSKYPDAGDLEPFVSYEYVDGKGNLYRLYFLGRERELSKLCREMKANGDWCNILK